MAYRSRRPEQVPLLSEGKLRLHTKIGQNAIKVWIHPALEVDAFSRMIISNWFPENDNNFTVLYADKSAAIVGCSHFSNDQNLFQHLAGNSEGNKGSNQLITRCT